MATPIKALSMLELRKDMNNKMSIAAATLLWQWSGLMPLVKFLPSNSLAYPWLQEAGLPQVGGRGLNEDFADQQEGAPDSPKLTGLAILGGKIKTDVINVEQKGDVARTRRIQKKIQAMSRAFDRIMLKGNAKTNPKKEFDGLYQRIPNAKVITNATNGAPADHKKVIELLDAVEGDNGQKVLIMNRTTRRNLSIDVGLRAGGRNVMDVGQQLKEFEGAKIVEVFNDETETAILPFDETCGNTSANTSITCVRFGGEMIEDGVQAISGLSGTINHRGPIDFGSYMADWIHFVTSIEIFSANSVARLKGVTATIPT